VELRVEPFETTLHVERGANLLSVLRRNALPISYSCNSGQCGLCRCEVIEGEVLQQGHELRDPAINFAHQNSILACQTVLTEDCTIRLVEPEDVVVYPAQILRAVVMSIDALSPAVNRVRLRSARPFKFSVGQYAMVDLAPGLARPYSMAGKPDERDLEIHVALIPGGRASSYVANDLRAGDSVRLSGPLGTSFLRRSERGSMLCVGVGTGVAPVLSIVREALHAGMRNAIDVYFAARSSAELYGVAAVRSLALRHRNVRTNIVALGDARAADARKGPVTEMIAADHRDLSEWRGYFFGVPSAVEAATILAKRLGMHSDRIHSEAFYPSGI
jgi:naphthalene 1,2-dioxygenase ferredoxin reductase component